jgi:hypothetical protein
MALNELHLIYKIETNKTTKNNGHCYINDDTNEVFIEYDGGYFTEKYFPFTDDTDLFKRTQISRDTYDKNTSLIKDKERRLGLSLPTYPSIIYVDAFNNYCFVYNQTTMTGANIFFDEEKVLQRDLESLENAYNKQQEYLQECHKHYGARYRKKSNKKNNKTE